MNTGQAIRGRKKSLVGRAKYFPGPSAEWKQGTPFPNIKMFETSNGVWGPSEGGALYHYRGRVSGKPAQVSGLTRLAGLCRPALCPEKLPGGPTASSPVAEQIFILPESNFPATNLWDCGILYRVYMEIRSQPRLLKPWITTSFFPPLS